MKRNRARAVLLAVAVFLIPFYVSDDLPKPLLPKGEVIMSTDKECYCVGEEVRITATGWAGVPNVGDFPYTFWAITDEAGYPVFETSNLLTATGGFNGTLNGTWNQTYRLLHGGPPHGQQVPPGTYTVWFYEIPRPNESVPGWIPTEAHIIECDGPVADAGLDQTVHEGDTVQFNGTGSYSQGTNVGGWSPRADVPALTWGVGSASLNGEIYYAGGNTFDPAIFPTSVFMKYNPATDSWHNLTDLPAARTHLGLVAVDGKVYAIGGSDGNQSVDTTYEYDPTTDAWATRSPMPLPMESFGVAAVNGRIYTVGGWSTWLYCYPCGEVFEYDPVNDSWSPKPGMPNPRAFLAVAVLEDEIFAIGGDSRGASSGVEVYDPIAETWSARANMSLPRLGLSAETLGDNIYAYGGTNEWGIATDVNEMYDPVLDNWSARASMLEPRVYFGSGVVGNCTYAMAGLYGPFIVGFPNSTEAYCLGGEFEYAWDFDSSVDSDGDGNFTNDVDATEPTPTHVYYDDGLYVATLTVTDAGGLSDSDTCNITVLNVPPTPEWTSKSSDGTILNPPYPEGMEILFEATVYDPGIYDTFTYDWDFGDGTILLDAGPSVTHTYGDNDLYIVVLTVTDDDGGVGIDDTPPLETTNEDPVASINMPFCIFSEGTWPCSPIGEFTDPGWLDTHAAVWNYGDGTYQTAVLTEENSPPDATGWNITSHIYGDDGTYTITFTVTDDDGGVGTASAEAQVMNLPPMLEVDFPESVDEGEDFAFSVAATDPGSDDLTIEIDWGDGTSEAVTYFNDGVGPDPPNSGEGVYPFAVWLNSTHVYGDNGNFTVHMSVGDDDGGSVEETLSIEVLNLPPYLALPRCCWPVNESELAGAYFSATDPGSDDLTVSWAFELGPSGSETHYNDGIGPDPPVSPWGTFPFSISRTLTHRYGDDGLYNLTIVVEDDDGGAVTVTRVLKVNNLPPTVEVADSAAGDEGASIEFQATASDPGSDDLTFVWDWGDGTTDTAVFYNDGIGPDPQKSPWGTFPFNVTHTVQHVWGDNGVFVVTLTVLDDDGNSTVREIAVTVGNVAPTIAGISYYLNASFAFRIAGEKWHDVEIHLFEDGTEVGYASLTRYPGSPNEQMADFGEFSINFSKTYSAVTYYTPMDDPINGQIWGATPAWVILGYEDGEERIHHTFNVRHEDTWTWEIDDFSPYFLGHNITFTATASDPGSDDLTFSWHWGDGNVTENIYYNDGVGPDPYPSPEVNPMTVTDTTRHAYGSARVYWVVLTVTDDDGGAATFVLRLAL